MEKIEMLFKKIGLLDTPIDAFANGFLISGLIWAGVYIWTWFVAIVPMLNNCVWGPKGLLPFGD